MKLANDQELGRTQSKLQLLEEQYRDAQSDLNESEDLREVTLFSLKQLINQLKEQIATYQACQLVRTP